MKSVDTGPYILEKSEVTVKPTLLATGVEAALRPDGTLVLLTCMPGSNPGEFEEHEVILSDTNVYNFVRFWLTSRPLSANDPRLRLVEDVRRTVTVSRAGNRHIAIL